MLTWPWGDSGSSWAGRAEGSSHLAPLKIKVTAELCDSGDEVGTCSPARNKQRLGSDSKFFFEGKSEEGPLLPCSGAALHCPCRACMDSSSPAPSLKNESHGRGPLF